MNDLSLELEIPSRLNIFLDGIANMGLETVVTGKSRKTLRIKNGSTNFGYINSTIIQREGIMGYNFFGVGQDADHCPESLVEVAIPYFCGRFNCESSDLDFHETTGSNAGRLFLSIRRTEVALRVLAIEVFQMTLR